MKKPNKYTRVKLKTENLKDWASCFFAVIIQFFLFSKGQNFTRSIIKFSADGHFGKAFGIVNLSATKINITSNEAGKYNVMVVGTRKDNAALAAWKGAERLKK